MSLLELQLYALAKNTFPIFHPSQQKHHCTYQLNFVTVQPLPHLMTYYRYLMTYYRYLMNYYRYLMTYCI